MRIGLLAPPWLAVPPRGYGGTELVVDALARALSALGHDVLLAAPGDSTCPVPRVPDLPESRPKRIESGVLEAAFVLAGHRALRDCDVVHDHTVLGPLVAERRCPRLAATAHNPFSGEHGPVYRETARRAALVAISAHHASTAAAPPAAVIRHGIDVDAVPLGGGGSGRALFLGRMTPDKGVHEAALAARAAGVPLDIAARVSDDERDYFDSAVAPLLGDDVVFLGEIDGPSKRELLGAALALVNPLRWPEPFGLVMVEALAAGTPVITRRCGAAPEIVDDGVTGVLRADVDGLADALRRVGELDRQDCRLAAERRFSSRRMAQDHLRLYTRLLERVPESRAPAHGSAGVALASRPVA